MTLVTIVWYLGTIFSPFISPKASASGILALLGMILGFQGRRWGLTALVASLPIAAGITTALSPLGIEGLRLLNNPGLDLAQGFVIGAAIMLYFEGRRDDGANLPVKPTYLAYVVTAFAAYLIASTAFAVAINLRQTGSPFSLRGFAFNALQIRRLSFGDDYYPLEGLYCLLLALSLCVCVTRLWRRNSHDCMKSVTRGLSLGGLALGLVAIAQQYETFQRYHSFRGVVSLLPDLHAYGSFALIAAAGAICYWSLLERSETRHRMLAAVSFVITCVGLFLSGSRFTLLCAPVVFAYGGYFLFLQHASRTTKVRAAGGFVALLMAGITVMSVYGYRKTDLKKLNALTSSFRFEDFNDALSQRPEMFAATWQMFADRPLTGIGNSNLHRLSAVKGYSTSDHMQKVGGENAHNYLLQLLTELGVIGFLLIVLLVALPGASHRSRLLILAVLAGNVFAHSLLIRELLMVFALILATHHLERATAVEGLTATMRSLVSNPSLRRGAFAACGMLCAGWLFAACRTDGYPFRRNDFCSLDHRRTPDGWIGTRYTKGFASRTRLTAIQLWAGHPDIALAPVEVTVKAVATWKKFPLIDERLVLADGNKVTLASAGQERFYPNLRITINASRCFVPQSLGISSDDRRLALNVTLETEQR